MNTRRQWLARAGGAAAGLAAWPAFAQSASPARASLAALQAHLRFLASPLLEGRETGSRGFDIAAAYVASHFARLGLQPLGAEGSYAQPVRLKTAKLASTQPVLRLWRGAAAETLTYLDDFSTRPDLAATRSEVTAPLVFAGFGIRAPAFGLDDYAGLDVKGRIVVVLSGRPLQLPSEEGAHYASRLTKAALAAELGAVGMISLATPRSELVSPFHLARQYAGSTAMDWRDADGRGGQDNLPLRGWASLSLQRAPALLAALGRDYRELVADAEAGKPVPRGDLGVTAEMTRDSLHGETRSANIVGLLPGRHPDRRHEVLLLTAHLDHLGRKAGPQGEVIYPGAMDNALGMATLLETATQLAQTPGGLDRSILIAALTGEEQGQLGSSMLAAQPPVPAAQLKAAVNIDMPILLHDFNEVVALGGDHSTLGATVARVAGELGLKMAADPQPEQARFTRSDQYSFVRRGIPAVILGPGTGSFNPQEDGAALMRDFRRLRYHQPGDDLGQPFHAAAMQRYAQLHVGLMQALATQAEAPRWLPGDFFGELFKPGR
ncbi:MAG: M28 family peptidase [Methylotenera sp.]|jgi:hypothetical protein|nr:M28 family peptidase [Methylotenera sp.]